MGDAFESRRAPFLSAQPEFDIRHLIEQAQVRWLKPPEICEILQNYKKYDFQLTPTPPDKPPSGSLFLFDRNALRHYRKDGHNWRKKNEGKSVREAHERLKVGSVEMLHCYYAHGEDNADFQRRSYWMLEGAHTNIVLVHYLELKQGAKSSVSQFADSYMGGKPLSFEGKEPFYLESEGLPTLSFKPEIASESVTSGVHLVNPSSLVGLVDPGGSYTLEQIQGREELIPVVHARHSPTLTSEAFQSLDTREMQDSLPDPALDLQSWDEFLNDLPGISLAKSSGEVKDSIKQEANSSNLEEMFRVCNDELLSNELPLADPHGNLSKGASGSSIALQNVIGGAQFQALGENAQAFSVDEDQKLKTQTLIWEEAIMDIGAQTMAFIDRLYLEQLLELDQFELASPMKFNGSPNPEKVQLRTKKNSNPPLSHEVKFSILDFSPDWGFSSEETKVLISGIFLTSENPLQFQWRCVFGEVEVPAQVSNVGVIICKAPRQKPGRVPFFVSTGSKRVHSQIKHFEYRMKTEDCLKCATPSLTPSKILSEKEEEAQLQIKLVRMLFPAQDVCKPERRISWASDKRVTGRYSSYNEDVICYWDNIEGLASVKSGDDLKEKIFQMVIKMKLQDRLLKKSNEGVKPPLILNDSGECILHLVAALGYDWAISPILASGIVVNFRDRRGRTALHWAALYGREKTVLALLAAGASPGALTDPTPKFVHGCTPADFAASHGHKGLAGYLAEVSLTTHLNSLKIIERDEKKIFSLPTGCEGEKAVEALVDRMHQLVSNGEDYGLSLEQSLRAVRNAAQTAALIKSAFRHQESIDIGKLHDYGLSSLDIRKLIAEQKLRTAFQTHWKKRHSAATQIQTNYRRWRRRRDFLDLRDRVIKIQAHVRAYLVRKQYKVLLWAVGVLEKAILRWRRKRTGLHQFHSRSCDAMEENIVGEDDDHSFLKDGRKQKELVIEKAVQRVQSMVMSSEARAQYSRLLDSSQQHQDQQLTYWSLALWRKLSALNSDREVLNSKF